MTTAIEAAPPSDAFTRRRPGWISVARKEMADHLLSGRFVALLFILGLVGVGTVYGAAGVLQDAAQNASDSDISPFLTLFTLTTDTLRFSFMALLGFLLPLLGIAYGFDAVSGERSRGTLPRLVSQPIHRDDVVNGKFVAGLSVISLTLGVVLLIVSGIGIFSLGIVPEVSDVFRLVTWYLASIVYVGVWLALATLFSVTMRSAATSAIVTIGIWLALTIFGGLLASLVAGVLSPVDANDASTTVANAQMQQSISRLSPVELYNEASSALLVPELRTLANLDTISASSVDRAIPSKLTFTQSLLLVWPQIVAMVAFTIVLFAIGYIRFMRQEVRA